MDNVLKKVWGKGNHYEDLDAVPRTPSPTQAGGTRKDGKVSVDDVITRIGFNFFHLKMSICSGFFWMTDAMEIMSLSIIGPAIMCDFRLELWQKAILTSIVFAGIAVSSGVWGVMADKYGRKTQLLMCSCFIFYFGLLSVVAPTFIWLLILRGLVGVGIGGVMQSVTLYAEFLPTKHRGTCLVLMEFFWAFGTMVVVLISMAVMPQLGWRYLLALICIPAFICIPICVWMPESPRFDLARGREDLALKTLKKIAKSNGKPIINTQLIPIDNKKKERGRIRDLFDPNYRFTTVLLWVLWFLNAFCYYGIVLMTTELFQMNDPCHGGDPSKDGNKAEACYLTCKKLDFSDYIYLLWTTSAEIPGLLVTFFLIELIGRKLSQAFEFLIFSIFIYLVNMCASRVVLTMFLFVARAAVTASFQTVFVYTAEVYPTANRALGIGLCNSICRIGAIITPFFAQVLLKSNLYIAINIYATLGVLGALAAFLLPIETKGKNMDENGDTSNSTAE